MFKTKNFIEIIGSMLSQMRATQNRITDYNVGGVARTMLEAPASEIDQLYQEMVQGLTEAVPAAIYLSFSFDLEDAIAASGVLRFHARPDHPEPITIPIGHLAATVSGQRYQTGEAGVIPVGETYTDVLAVALEPGVAGNVPAESIRRIISSRPGLIGVTNPQAFANGRGKETEPERKLRFVEYVRTLARATPAALRYAAKQAVLTDPLTGVAVERVARVDIEETTGHVDLYIHNGAGSTSTMLVDLTQKLIEGYDDPATSLPVAGYRPAGMRVDVQPMTEVPVNVRLRVEVAPNLRTDAVKTAIRQALRDTIRAVPSRGRLLPLDLINSAVALDVVMGAEIDQPTLTVFCPVGSVLVAGTLDIEWATLSETGLG